MEGAGEESDRLLIRWQLDSERAVAASQGRPHEPDAETLRRSATDAILVVGRDGKPSSAPPQSRVLLIQVPDDSLSYNITTLIRSTLSYNYQQSPIYEEKIRRGQTNGYAALDASAHVPVAQLGTNAHAGYVLGTDGSIASWQAGAGYGFNTGQFAVVSVTNIAIRSGAMATNLSTWVLLNTHAFTNGGKIVTTFANASGRDHVISS